MASQALPQVDYLTPILHVRSVEESIAWFCTLGWRPGFRWNDSGLLPKAASGDTCSIANFGSVQNDKLEIFLCVNGQGTLGDRDTEGVWMSWWMSRPEDVDHLHQVALLAGFQIDQPPTDEPWGVREFHLRHPDGHVMRVSSGLTANGSPNQR